MKIREIRDLDDAALKNHLKDMDEQMFRLQFQLRMGQTDGLKKIRNMKKDRARIHTVLRERELAGAEK
ncbi:MAG TPA: 50S ribosomal protein L29 [Bryobacteraceae bacterium]|jgi:large subunit ribosomal protein L29|nr:50S ribosomal protein L29 [Bryobacteraceae bacterium]